MGGAKPCSLVTSDMPQVQGRECCCLSKYMHMYACMYACMYTCFVDNVLLQVSCPVDKLNRQ